MFNLIFTDEKTTRSYMFKDGKQTLMEYPVKKYIEIKCIEQGATYRGRVDAVIEQFNYKTKTPILFGVGRSYIVIYPLESISSKKPVWICANNVYEFIEKDFKTEIRFSDGSVFETNYSVTSLKSLHAKAMNVVKYYETNAKLFYEEYSI